MRRSYFALIVALMFVGVVRSQTAPSPRLLYVMPPGGQAGSTFDVVVSGQDLNETSGLHFSFPGTKVEYIGTEKGVMVDPKVKKPPVATIGQKFKVTLP